MISPLKIRIRNKTFWWNLERWMSKMDEIPELKSEPSGCTATFKTSVHLRISFDCRFKCCGELVKKCMCTDLTEVWGADCRADEWVLELVLTGVRGMDEGRGETASSTAWSVNDLLFLVFRRRLVKTRTNCRDVISPVLLAELAEGSSSNALSLFSHAHIFFSITKRHLSLTCEGFRFCCF